MAHKKGCAELIKCLAHGLDIDVQYLMILAVVDRHIDQVNTVSS